MVPNAQRSAETNRDAVCKTHRRVKWIKVREVDAPWLNLPLWGGNTFGEALGDMVWFRLAIDASLVRKG